MKCARAAKGPGPSPGSNEFWLQEPSQTFQIALDSQRMSAGQWTVPVSSQRCLRAGHITSAGPLLDCQIGPRSRPDMAMACLGEPRLAGVANALFDLASDCAIVFSQGKLTRLAADTFAWQASRPDEPTTVEIIPHYFRDRHSIRHYVPLDKRIHQQPPSGWCSWYYYFTDINEAEMLLNARWVGEHLRPWGARYVQLDDGWQGVGEGGGWNRDWTVIAPKFPHGLRWLADRIHDLGLLAGLWVIPFSQSSDDLHAADPRASGCTVLMVPASGSIQMGRTVGLGVTFWIVPTRAH